MVEPDHHVWSEMASQLFSPFIHLIKMNVKTGTVRWMPRLSLDSLNKSRSAPELPNHWCCKPCLLSVLGFWFDRETQETILWRGFRSCWSNVYCQVHFHVAGFCGEALQSCTVRFLRFPTKEPTGVPKVSMDWVCQHQNVWAPKQSEEPLQATGSWTSRHPVIVVSTLWKSTLCVLFLIFNLKLKSGVSIQTSKATSPRKLFSIWRVWHSSKS